MWNLCLKFELFLHFNKDFEDKIAVFVGRFARELKSFFGRRQALMCISRSAYVLDGV